MSFTGKTVVITGGAAGIGWACAEIFAARGARVALLDLNGDLARDRADELGADHLGLAVDVTDEQAVISALDEIGKGYVSAEREAAFTEPGKVWGVMRKAPKGGKLFTLFALGNLFLVRRRPMV